MARHSNNLSQCLRDHRTLDEAYRHHADAKFRIRSYSVYLKTYFKGLKPGMLRPLAMNLEDLAYRWLAEVGGAPGAPPFTARGLAKVIAVDTHKVTEMLLALERAGAVKSRLVRPRSGATPFLVYRVVPAGLGVVMDVRSRKEAR